MVTEEKVGALLSKLNAQKEQGIAQLNSIDEALANLRVQRDQQVAQLNAIEGAMAACNSLLRDETVLEEPAEKRST